MEMASDGRYGDAVPQIRDHLERYQRALDGVKFSHRGRPIDEVRRALASAFQAEGIEVWKEVAEDAVRLISEDRE
ncbi:hypothetical protein [Frankia nepalensis]|uniref:Uncharacterized protein n=1 Tax=Frankia nepalensis TaxID=1836974 RepID=A0A937RBA6_9ACTN|nr:hypothetical protein [Frankia nepalensis]MBL7500244.1 hypothetical protein [Frankia nepalensis]MBL7513520.1 hypothetical protein [Frankia nepalensis]MBL7628983.1 hypothetical protein [Frankia nepalensis]